MTDNVQAPETAPQGPITNTDEAVSRIDKILSGDDTIAGAPQETPAEPVNDTEAAVESAPEEPTSGDENDNGKEPDENPPLKMPLSWSKDDIAVWNVLPREAQEKIAQREQQRDRDIRTKQNELAEIRKQAEAKTSEIEAYHQQYLAQAPQLMVALKHVVDSDPTLQMTEAQLAQLAQEDPGSYVQVQAHRTQKFRAIDQAVNEYHQIQQQAEFSKLQKLHEWRHAETAKLHEMIPEFADPVKSEKLVREIKDYGYEVGFTDEELLSVFDHRYVRVLRDAAIGRTLSDKQAIAKTKIANATKTVTPTGHSKSGGQQDRDAAKRALRSAKTNDQAAAILEKLL